MKCTTHMGCSLRLKGILVTLLVKFWEFDTLKVKRLF